MSGTGGCGTRQGNCGPMTSQRLRTITENRLSRRGALRAGGLGVAASLGAGGLNRVLAQDATPVTTYPIGAEQAQDGLSVDVIELFGALPGTKALKIWAPPDAGRPAWSAASDADRQLVIASAFKVF